MANKRMTKEKAIAYLKSDMQDYECDECFASDDANYDTEYMREACEHREAYAMAIRALGGEA